MNQYQVIKAKRVTEKGRVIENLVNAKSNKSISRCQTPKIVFDVDAKANKRQIADAVEEIYKDRKVKVTKVNTINVKPKKRRVRGFLGMTSGFKKAIVSFRPGDSIEVGG